MVYYCLLNKSPNQGVFLASHPGRLAELIQLTINYITT
jgi:hypothetical protein